VDGRGAEVVIHESQHKVAIGVLLGYVTKIRGNGFFTKPGKVPCPIAVPRIGSRTLHGDVFLDAFDEPTRRRVKSPTLVLLAIERPHEDRCAFVDQISVIPDSIERWSETIWREASMAGRRQEFNATGSVLRRKRLCIIPSKIGRWPIEQSESQV